MTTQTQSILEVYQSVLNKFNLYCEMSLLYENLLYIYKEDDIYLGGVDLSTGEIISYVPALTVETINQVVEDVYEQTTKVSNNNWQQYQAELVETSPKVIDVIRGRLPEYLQPLYILSTMTYKTEDNKVSYRIAVCNKSTNVSTAFDSFYLVLDTKNNYRGFADNEYRACELAELIIRKPTPEYQIQR